MGRTSLIMVIVVSTLILFFGGDLSKVSTSAYENYLDYYCKAVAHTIATSVANMACNEIYLSPNWRVGYSNLQIDGGTANATVDTVGGGKLRVVVTSQYNLVKDTIIVLWGLTAFSKFAYYSFIEGDIYWITGDTVWGPFHSQQRVNVSGDPVFYGKVTAKNGLFKKPKSSQPKFYGGFQAGVSLTLPVDFQPLKVAAQTGGRYVSKKDVSLTFNGDGSVTYQEGTGPVTTVSLSEYAGNGAIYVDNANLRIKGTLSGKVTVAATGSSGAAKGNVFLDDDVVYAHDPRNGPSEDLLGICADNDVVISENASNNSDIRIDGSVFSRSGGVKAENHNGRPVSGTIYLLGGIIQYQRGPVGTFSGSPPVIDHGFQKRYLYDDRLMVDSPPYFPTTGSYEILSWYER
jgi:hypothetical protein